MMRYGRNTNGAVQKALDQMGEKGNIFSNTTLTTMQYPVVITMGVDTQTSISDKLDALQKALNGDIGRGK